MNKKRFFVTILFCILAISIFFISCNNEEKCDNPKEISYDELLDKLSTEKEGDLEKYDQVVIYVGGYKWQANFIYSNNNTEIFIITDAPSIYDYNSYSLFMTELQSMGVSLSKIKMELAEPNK